MRVHAGWLPFAINAAGDYYAIDCSPAKGGKVGQVVLVMHESYYRPLISKTFTDFVKDLAEAYKSRKYSLPEDSADIRKAKRDSFPTYNFDKEDAVMKSVKKKSSKTTASDFRQS